MRFASVKLLASCFAIAACAAPESRDQPAPPITTVGVDEAAASARAVAAVPIAPAFVRQPALPTPRKAFAARLTPLWTKHSFDTDTQLVVPNDLMFTTSGLMTFDHGDLTLRVYEPTTGRYLRRFGRGGAGPGEFSRVMWFQGTYDAPVLFDPTLRRLTTAFEVNGELESRPLGGAGTWLSTCALDDRTTIGTVYRDSQPDLMIVRDGKLVDSLSAPWPELEGTHAIVRQSIIRQIDAGTCAIVTLYQPFFATYSQLTGFTAGRFVESAEPIAALIESLDGGKGRKVSLPNGTVAGANGVGMWRDHVIILYNGRTALRRRLLDLYRRDDLSYAGSIVLPFESTRLAVRGDTLAVIGEVDDYPVLAVFVLRP